jgi:hypothetical protein
MCFTAGIFFDFPRSVDPEHDLGPGETLVVVKNLAAFASRYDTGSLAVAGEYKGNLGNDGERIRLVDLLGRTLLELEYSDEWYPSTDGGGGSLEIIDPHAGPGTWGLREGWRAGPELGSPGRTAFAGPARGGLQRQGDLNQDGVVSLPDAVAILVRLFESGRAWPCEETHREDGNLILADVDGDGKVLLSDAVYLLAYLFGDGPPPALGPACVRIPGCPDVCE